MQIKTITEHINYPGLFDRKVNEALEEGWILEKRYISTNVEGPRRFIAELVKDKEVT